MYASSKRCCVVSVRTHRADLVAAVVPARAAGRDIIGKAVGFASNERDTRPAIAVSVWIRRWRLTLLCLAMRDILVCSSIIARDGHGTLVRAVYARLVPAVLLPWLRNRRTHGTCDTDREHNWAHHIRQAVHPPGEVTARERFPCQARQTHVHAIRG